MKKFLHDKLCTKIKDISRHLVVYPLEKPNKYYFKTHRRTSQPVYIRYKNFCIIQMMIQIYRIFVFLSRKK